MTVGEPAEPHAAQHDVSRVADSGRCTCLAGREASKTTAAKVGFAVVINSATMKKRLSVPALGRTVSAESEERAVHVRRAVDFLEPELRSPCAGADFATVFSPRWDGGNASPADEPVSLRIAWALVNIWILARMNAGGESMTGFRDAEAWFVGGHRAHLPSLSQHLSKDAESWANRTLSRLCFDTDFFELLPYVLELHGPGSRLSIMRDPATRSAREAKRRSGVFYTPADVAEYMAEGVLAGQNSVGNLRCLDPSCGTGVFFVALLRTIANNQHDGKPIDRLAFATRCLYGFDISTVAIESSAFVLLHHCIADAVGQNISPWAAWHALRLNLTATDALKLQPVSDQTSYTDAAWTRQSIRDRLLQPSEEEVPPVVERLPTINPQPTLFGQFTAEASFPPLGALFAEAETGFDVLIGNPPYADLSERDDQQTLEQEYSSMRRDEPTGRNIYPLFIEMMWRLTRPGKNRSALVVPLSISFHQGSQYKACRHAMMSHGGRWRCAFFDREPHALFGEDVKTRNAILFRNELADDPARGSQAVIETGPLRKWTSRTREKLFASINFTPLRRVNIGQGIPKLSGTEQAEAYSVLNSRPDNLRTFCTSCRTCDAREATMSTNIARVFVASTAYNFLNVFRSITPDSALPYPLTENPVHCLEFAKEETAELAFAILSSSLTFWLWHVEGDGFHVGAWFIQSLPFGRSSFSPKQAEILREAGRTLWHALQPNRIVSVNRGKQTIAYRPLTCERERDAIDDVLLEAALLPKSFKCLLREFVTSTVIVDRTDRRRDRLKSLFNFMEDSP